MPDSPLIASGRAVVSSVVVLAAGSGTRMRSSLPKVLHPIAGKPLLWHAMTAAADVGPGKLVAVIGHGRDLVGAYLTEHLPDVEQAVQEEQLGTGHAVACGLVGPEGPDSAAVAGTVLVTYGDVPLLTGETLRSLADAHHQAGNAVTVLTALVDDPTGYGRIVRSVDGALEAIIEQKDADADQRAIREINSGVYAFDGRVLIDALGRLTTANAAGERYLTDVVALARGDGHPVGAMVIDDPDQTEGVNDRVQLADLSRKLNARLVRKAQLSGVTVTDPATTWIHADVHIGPDTQILPGTSLEAGTVIGSDCVIGPDTTLSGCRVADGASVTRSHCTGAIIGVHAAVGPYSFLRAGAELGEKAKAGAFVEIKQSTLGPGAKVPHLSYVGDAQIGAGTNLGAGTITANYDGVTKSRTIIGANAFIGTDSTLVAPVTIADGTYVAAGSTITDAVEAGDLAIARGRQHAVKGWVLRRRAGTASDRAARAAGAIPRPDPISPDPIKPEPTSPDPHAGSAESAAVSGEDSPA